MGGAPTTTQALWLAVIASGLYHGLNPAMGWPLAVSAALMERRAASLYGALGALGAGHLLAMAAILLPFALLTTLVEWQRQIRIAAALAVIGYGLWLLIRRRHPRFIARIRPGQVTLWSFAIATAHGAGLMLVPIYLGICHAGAPDAAHRAAATLIGGDLETALVVALAHTAAMLIAGGLMAVLVYRWLGLKVLPRTWLRLDAFWAASLVAVGGIALTVAVLA